MPRFDQTDCVDIRLRQRRSLNIICIAFLVFLWAGGDVGDQITLAQVGIKLENKTVLVMMCWGALAWFTWRFWIFHKGGIPGLRKRRIDDFNTHRGNIQLINKIKNKAFSVAKKKEFGPKIKSDDMISLKEISPFNLNWKFAITRVYPPGQGDRKIISVNLHFLRCPLKKIRYMYASALQMPDFSEIALPYFLVMLVVMSALVRYFWL